jgi:murein DD-endopeptidase MepM/ murein hydrolase activator NlpD
VQIILIPDQLGATKTLNLHARHIVAGFGLLLLIIFTGAAALSWFSIQWRLPVVENLLLAMQRQETHRAERFMSGNLQSLANRLGELQVRMTQLDDLGKRLAVKIGVEPAIKDKNRQQEPQGGPFVPAPLDEASLRQEIERLAAALQEKSLTLDKLESHTREHMLRQTFLPTILPVSGGAYLGSPFGNRIDPFGRGRAIHEGLDFVAPHGTPILAAADGVVVHAAYHPEFGNLVEINHGGEQITRYAHLSDISVNVGVAVRGGQQVGLLGNTGRSTGPHLHFEVRRNGAALDPEPFLARSLTQKTP